MSRLPSLTLALLLALAGACDDENSGPSDAGQDARRDGSSGCRMADCQDMKQPAVACSPGSMPEFTCIRTFDQKCVWGQERCVPGGDGGTTADAAGTDAAADAPADAPVD